jgi:hypothetical protein
VSSTGCTREQPTDRATKTLVALTRSNLDCAWRIGEPGYEHSSRVLRFQGSVVRPFVNFPGDNGGMAFQNPLASRGRVVPTMPKGDVLGVYETYLEAQRVVDRLAKAEFPVKQVAIVGSDLRTVERVTGKMSYGRAAGAGAASGAWFGLFFGLLLFIFAGSTGSIPFVGAAALIGAGFGMLFSIVSYTLSRRRRDFTSVHQVLAGKYEIIVDSSLTIRAQELLARPEPTNP